MTPCVFSAWTFSTLSPPLLAGELFQCSVQIAASAPPGNYPVNLRDGGAGGRGGIGIPAAGAEGAVHALQPPGGGGCAVTPVLTGKEIAGVLGPLSFLSRPCS